MRFAVAGLGGPAASAILRLYVTDASPAGGVLYAVPDVSWGESTITWSTRPTLGSQLATIGAVRVNTWVELDVSAQITGSGSYAFAISGVSSDVAYYSSEEGPNPPQLIVR